MVSRRRPAARRAAGRGLGRRPHGVRIGRPAAVDRARRRRQRAQHGPQARTASAWSPDADADRLQRRLRGLRQGPAVVAVRRRRRTAAARARSTTPACPIPWIRWSPDGARLRFSVFDRAERGVVVDGDPGGRQRARRAGSYGASSATGRRTAATSCSAAGALGGNATRKGRCFNLYARREPRRLWPLAGRRRIEQLTFGPMDFSEPGLLSRRPAPGGLRHPAADGAAAARAAAAPLRAGARRARRVRRLLARRRVGRLGRRVAPDAVAQPARRLRAGCSSPMPPMAAALAHWSPDGRRLVFVGRPGRRPAAAQPCTSSRATAGRLDSFADPHDALVWDPCWLDDEPRGLGQPLRARLGEGARPAYACDLDAAGLGGMMGPKCAPDGCDPRREGVEPGLLAVPSRRPAAGRDLGVRSDLWYPTFTRDGSAVLRPVARRARDLPLHARRRGGSRSWPTSAASSRPHPGWRPGWASTPTTRPLVLRNTGVADLYVLDWEES